MPNYAVIENQKVSNIVVADLEFAAQHDNWVECPDGVFIGCSYLNGDFVNATPQPSEEEVADSVRFRRNQLLERCDWTQLPDAPVDAAPWATYRQALRDISSQAGFPWDVQWPEEPA